MSEHLYSSAWYRVADLHPRLRSHARVHRHLYRGEVWYVMQDQATGRFHRYTAAANYLIGLMDGTRSMQQIWDAALLRLGSNVPHQEEVIRLLSDLHRADILQSDVAPDVDELHRRRKQVAKNRTRQDYGNPLSLRFPVLDPDRLLNRITPWLGWLVGWRGLLLGLPVLAYALLLGVSHWSELADGLAERVFILYNLLLMALLYPIIKILHEFGHAVAIKRYGGEVHEMGVMLLMLMPIPYVDATAANALSNKYQRMITGAAGILVEVFIAALALVAWVHLSPGLARAVAYDTILITGVSTLIFNGNPLLRYDGYYILADYLEIPNLGQRANDYFGYCLNRTLFGVEGVEAPQLGRGEARWLFWYAIASFCYRMFVTMSIVLTIAGQYFLIGGLLAIWSVYSMMLLPALIKISQMLSSPALRQKRWRSIASGLGLVVTVVLLFGVLRFPSSTSVQGIIWAPEQSLVRAGVNAQILRVVAAPMQPVKKGDILFECEEPLLLASMHQNQAELEELQIRYNANLETSRLNAALLQKQLAQAEAVLAMSRERVAQLTIRSPVDGLFIVDTPQDMTGRFVQRGQLLAYVNQAADPVVRLVLPQDAVERVHRSATHIDIRTADHPSDVIAAHISREVPAATDQLPSVSLSLQGGGTIGINPVGEAQERGEVRALERLFIMDLQLPPGSHLSNLGSRVYVRFSHAPEPLARQWWRAGRRLLLNRFNI